MTIFKFKPIFSFFSFSLFTFNAYSADPATLSLSVYKVAVSTSPLCTNLTTILDNGSTPTTVNFLSAPTIGNGSVANGIYKCVAIEFSDTISFTTATTTGSCTAGTAYTINVCRSGTSTLIDGTSVPCTTGTERVAMYLSTAATSTSGSDSNSAFLPPTNEAGDATRGLNLASPLTVTGSVISDFVVNATDKISGSGATCDMQPPTFSFRVP